MSVVTPGVNEPPGGKVEDPEPNKALANLVTWAAGLAVQWITTGEFTLGQEGVTTAVGLVSTVLVYYVSNWRKRNARVEGKARPHARG